MSRYDTAARRPSRTWLMYGALSALLLPPGATGCGGVTMDLPVPVLTSKAELERVAAEPVDPPELPRIARPIESWQLEGPFPSVGGPSAPEGGDVATAWLLQRQTPAAGWRATEPMRCIARETARALEEGDALDPRLRIFIAGACGATTPHYGMQYTQLGGAMLPNVAMVALTPQLEPALQQLGVGDEVGAWLSSSPSRTRLTLVTASPSIAVEPFSRAPDANNRVRFSGRFAEEVESLGGYITEGDLGYLECNVDATLPDFTVNCPMPSDDAAVIEVVSFGPDRLLGSVRLQTVVAQPEADLGQYRVESLLVDAAGATTRNALVAAVNRLRDRRGLAPLALEERQSAFQDLVAPHLLAASLRDDDPAAAAEADRIALGLIAGWDVGARISDGDIATLWVPHGAGADGWLYEVQRSPSSRRSLFDAAASRVAVGSVDWDGSGMLGFIVTTYTDTESGDPEDEAALVRQRLNAARERAGRPAARRLRHQRMERAMASVVSEVEAGEIAPEDALGVALNRLDNIVRRGGTVYGMTASRLDELTFPGRLLTEPVLNVIVGVAQVDVPGSPWTLDLILIANIEGAMDEI